MAELARAAGARQIVAVGTPPRWHGTPPLPARRGGAGVRRLSGTRCASFDFAPNRGKVFSAHQMGTVRMGAANDHPAIPRGRVRDRGGQRRSPGLYVADGSLFPTGIGVNPMITIMALARRVARTVAAEGDRPRPRRSAVGRGPGGGSLVDRPGRSGSPAPGSGARGRRHPAPAEDDQGDAATMIPPATS